MTTNKIRCVLALACVSSGASISWCGEPTPGSGSNIIDPKVIVIDGRITNLNEISMEFGAKLCSAKPPVRVNGQVLRISPEKMETDPATLLGFDAKEFSIYERIRSYRGLLFIVKKEVESGRHDEGTSQMARKEKDHILSEIASLSEASRKSRAHDKLRKELENVEEEQRKILKKQGENR